MCDERFFPETSEAEPPMTLNLFSEGVSWRNILKGSVAFDIETFSPMGFPANAEDPVVNFSLVAPLKYEGLLIFSALSEPSAEGELLLLLHRFLSFLRGFRLLTYNGLRFDLDYVEKRGKLYGLGLEKVFASLQHIDVYRCLSRLGLDLPRYDQKTVERCLGIGRVVQHVSGGSYHFFYRQFLKGGNLAPIFYNMEDSFGCLKIFMRLQSCR